MSDFEFSRYVTIGQHLPTGSIIHRLDPRARLLSGLALLVAITFARHLLGLGIAVVGLLVLLRIARIPGGFALRGLLPPLPILLLLAAFQVFFGPQTQAGVLLSAWGPIKISTASLLAGGILLLRFAALILALSLISFTLATTELVRGLEALLRPLTRLGLPTQDFILLIQVALRFQPLLAREAERIAKAQASRGADWGTGRGSILRRVRQLFPLLIPLFLIGLQRAEQLALAMVARGYQSRGQRSSMVELHFTRADTLAVLLTGILSGLILGL